MNPIFWTPWLAYGPVITNIINGIGFALFVILAMYLLARVVERQAERPADVRKPRDTKAGAA